MEIPGEKLIIKLWETIADRGIGSLLKPWQIRREGRANLEVRRDEILALAQAEADAVAIRSGRKLLMVSGEIVNRPALEAALNIHENTDRAPLVLPRAIEIADQNAKADAVRQEVSIAKAVIYAEEELQNDSSDPLQDSPQDDWLLRWRECAAGVSSDELQQIWGKVLAGEVKSPGRFSLRTLEFLRNLSQTEAQAIERISPFVISGVLYRGNDAVLEAEGVSFSDLLAMQELGVLAGVDGLGLEITWNSNATASFQKALTCHGALILATAPDPNKIIKLKVCTVTAIGKQVLSLGSFSPNAKMVESVATAIKALGFDVQVGSYFQVGPDQVQPVNLKQI
jgi:hypothetical protein